jgi:hypothetical protein
LSTLDKPKIEVAVQIVERWILARLRHETFFSRVHDGVVRGGVIPSLRRGSLSSIKLERRSHASFA